MKADEIRLALLTGSSATYNGGEYKILSFVLYYNKLKKTLSYSAELLDKNERSVVRVPIEQVEVIKGGES